MLPLADTMRRSAAPATMAVATIAPATNWRFKKGSLRGRQTFFERSSRRKQKRLQQIAASKKGHHEEGKPSLKSHRHEGKLSLPAVNLLSDLQKRVIGTVGG
jgi:hypothetical protein